MKKFWRSLGQGLLRTTTFKRRAFFLFADALLIAVSLYLAMWLRFEGNVPESYLNSFILFLAPALLMKMVLLAVFGMYGFTWRFFGLGDLLKLVPALALASLVWGTTQYFVGRPIFYERLPRSILLLDFNITIIFLGALRISKRAVREMRRSRTKTGKIKVLIIGAGSAGEQIGREMRAGPKSKYYPVGYVDDDPAKLGVMIHGIKVLGDRSAIKKIIKSGDVDEILVAIPSADSRDIRAVVGLVREAKSGLKIKMLPGILGLMDGNVTLSDIKEIQVEDLLGREPVEIDYAAIRNFIRGKRVLVTGSGGSIGSEVARTILQFGPAKAYFLDCDETELFYLVNRLKAQRADILPIIGDIRDRTKMRCVFKNTRPEIVIHTAALKHVPILEHYPEEAVKTNVLGTKILGELAVEFQVEKFVNISTDKAINPTSIMGASKRVGEEVLKVLNRRAVTRFISVRFGNVLGSRGSVIPQFTEQIKRGGPVTVTHPKMRRYFMAPSEAVLLVLEAASIGTGGEAYVLDMGEMVKIDDLAREMIRLSGYEPDVDIPIVYTGLRAGEKLYEELLTAEEGSEPTEHVKVFRAKDTRVWDERNLYGMVETLIELRNTECGPESYIDLLKAIVPTFQHDTSQIPVNHW